MTIQLPPDVELALRSEAVRLGMTPDSLAEQTLRQQLIGNQPELSHSQPSLEPIDEWERKLRAIARPCGVSHTNEQLSSEGLYD